MPRKRKASQEKIDACRANGAKGAGKKSEESRQKCAANSLKHGLCATAASSMLLPSESAEMYNQLLDAYMNRYRPQDECERQVLLQIHYAMWRMRRIPTIETTLLHSEIMRINKRPDESGFKDMGEGFKVGVAFKNLANNDRSFDLLNRYESRIQRSFSRLTQDLDKLQSNRPIHDDGPVPATPRPSTPPAEKEQCKNEANPPSGSPAPAARDSAPYQGRLSKSGPSMFARLLKAIPALIPLRQSAKPFSLSDRLVMSTVCIGVVAIFR